MSCERPSRVGRARPCEREHGTPNDPSARARARAEPAPAPAPEPAPAPAPAPAPEPALSLPLSPPPASARRVVALTRLRISFASLLAFLVAFAPMASAAHARAEALKIASDFDPTTEHSVELVAHGGHAVALPSGASVELPAAPAALLPATTRGWTLAVRVAARPVLAAAPPPPFRTRVGVTIPRRCPPRLEDDDGP